MAEDRIGVVGVVSMLVAAAIPFTGAPVWSWGLAAIVAFLVVPLWENRRA